MAEKRQNECMSDFHRKSVISVNTLKKQLINSDRTSLLRTLHSLRKIEVVENGKYVGGVGVTKV